MEEQEKQTESQPEISIEQRDRLIDVLESLENLTKKQVSLKFVLIRGSIYGLGTVIGATVLISVVSFITIQLFGNTVADESEVEETVNSFLSQ